MIYASSSIEQGNLSCCTLRSRFSTCGHILGTIPMHTVYQRICKLPPLNKQFSCIDCTCRRGRDCLLLPPSRLPVHAIQPLKCSHILLPMLPTAWPWFLRWLKKK